MASGKLLQGAPNHLFDRTAVGIRLSHCPCRITTPVSERNQTTDCILLGRCGATRQRRFTIYRRLQSIAKIDNQSFSRLSSNTRNANQLFRITDGDTGDEILCSQPRQDGKAYAGTDSTDLQQNSKKVTLSKFSKTEQQMRIICLLYTSPSPRD